MKNQVWRSIVVGLMMAIWLIGCSGGTPSVVYDSSKGDKPFPPVVGDKAAEKKVDGFPAVGQGVKKK